MGRNKIRVLLVDDHAVVRNGIRLMLGMAPDIEAAGEAETAHEALQAALTGDFDVVLVDVNLPDQSGLDLIKQLRRLEPKLAAVVLSAYPEEIYAMRAFKYGAAAYLSKNSSTDVIIATVRKAATGGKYVSPLMMEKFAGMMSGEKIVSHEALSERELAVLLGIASGAPLVKIAEQLHLSPSTVTTYRARVLEKMGMKSNAELSRYAFENDLLT